MRLEGDSALRRLLPALLLIALVAHSEGFTGSSATSVEKLRLLDTSLSAQPFSPGTMDGRRDVLTLQAVFGVRLTDALRAVEQHSSNANQVSFFVEWQWTIFTVDGSASVVTLRRTEAILPPFEKTSLRVADGSIVEIVVVRSSQLWNGLAENGSLATDGSHPFRIDARTVRLDASGSNAVTGGAVQRKVIDTIAPVRGAAALDDTAPSLRIVEPVQDAILTNGAVMVTLEYQDLGSGLDPSSFFATENGTEVTSDFTLAAGSATGLLPGLVDGPHCLNVGVRDFAGNESRQQRCFTVDTTPPRIVAVVSPPPNANGWNSTDVTVTFICEDIESGIASCPAPALLSNEGSGQSVGGVAVDRAGHSSRTEVMVNIDKTPPLLASFEPPACPASVMTFRPRVRGCFTDALSGVDDGTLRLIIDGTDRTSEATSSGGCIEWVSLVDLSIGQHQAEFRASDRAGLQVSGSSCIEILPLTPPRVFDVTSPTRHADQLLSGETLPGVRIRVIGGRDPVETQALGNGMFMLNVPLQLNTTNLLSVAAVAQGGQSSDPTLVTILQNEEIPPPMAGGPARINVFGGDMQAAMLGEPLIHPLEVIVTDTEGNPVFGVPVTFKVMMGSGALAGGVMETSLTTDTRGVAGTTFTMGPNAPGLREVRANFLGNQELALDFMLTGLAPRPVEETRVSGVVLTHDMRGIPGVRIRLLGTPLEALTDAAGGFVILDVTPTDEQKVEIDASGATIPGHFSDLEIVIPVLAGQNNSMGKPIFLPDLNPGVDIPIDPVTLLVLETRVIEFPSGSGLAPITLTVPQGTHIVFPAGAPHQISITDVPPNRIPMQLGEGRFTRMFVTIQPPGAHFNPPLPITFPNVDGDPPGAKVRLMSFDHHQGRYIDVGSATVSEDGKLVASDPGVGIVQGGWHGTPMNPRDVVGTVIATIPSGLSCECWAENAQPCIPMQSTTGSTTACIANNLPVGRTTVAPSITDPQGNRRSVTAVQCRCTFPLSVKITQPADKDVVCNQQHVLAKGTATGTANVTVDGASVPVVNGQWTKDVTLAMGISDKTITAVAAQNGSSATDSVKIKIISSVAYAEDPGQKFGYDDYSERAANHIWKSVGVSAADTAMANIMPTGNADGVFFESTAPSIIDVSPPQASASPQKVTVTGLDRGVSDIEARCGRQDGPVAATLNAGAYEPITRTLAVILVHEENDDVQVIPVGRGLQNAVAIRAAFLLQLQTSAPGGDDQIAGNTVTTGADGICQTTAIGTDVQVIPVGQGKPDEVCVSQGNNGERDTNNSGDDTTTLFGLGDDITTGPDGICNTAAVSTDVLSTDIGSVSTLTGLLNQTVYNQAAISWTVTKLPARTVNFDLNRNGMVDVNAPYTSEMKRIIDRAGDSSYDYNVFLVDNPLLPGLRGILFGIMNFNQPYGFIFGNNHVGSFATIENTICHELGHGQGLCHPDDAACRNDPDTNNLMIGPRSGNPTRLRKYQWDQLNP